MKLAEVQTKEKVPTGSVGDMTVRLLSAEGPAPAWGWSLTFEQGLVTATKGDRTMVIPIGNVVYMLPTPHVAEPKAKATKPAA